MADKDYFDRIADALEIIAGDDSHVDEVDKNMDYYKRIAAALEVIAENGGSSEGGSSSGQGPMIVSMNPQTMTLDKTWQEIKDAEYCILKMDSSGEGNLFYAYLNLVGITYNSEYIATGQAYSVSFLIFENNEAHVLNFYAASANDYPVLDANA